MPGNSISIGGGRSSIRSLRSESTSAAGAVSPKGRASAMRLADLRWSGYI
jgi:hypothetical protein